MKINEKDYREARRKVRRKKRVEKLKNNKGFSLVELIIVIAIMAILAASIAPSLIRYIKKSRAAKAIAEAKCIQEGVISGIALAADQGVYVFLNKEYTDKNGVTHTNCGVITNWNFSRAQQGAKTGRIPGDIHPNSNNPQDQGTYADYLIATEALLNLGSADATGFNYINFTGTVDNPIGVQASTFYKRYKCPGVIVVYDYNGSVVMLEYYNYGILVHYEDGEYTIKETDRFVNKDTGTPNIKGY